MEEKKILIVGPIGDRGGREIEAGFFAKSLLAEGFHVKILSTAYITGHSQLFSYVPVQNVTSIYETLYDKNLILQTLARIAWVKNMGKQKPFFYTSNYFAKKLLNYKKEVNKIIKENIYQYDLILFLGQLSSNNLREFINYSKRYKKKFILRTTGEIIPETNVPLFLNQVDLFLHHSAKNQIIKLLKINPNYETLDQTALNESLLLKIPNKKTPIRSFIMIGEICKNKGVSKIIDYFTAIASSEDELLILGTGIQRFLLEEKFKLEKRIKFLGYINHDELPVYLDKADCLIIASESETGPLVGLEAMAAGRIILSTRVGAMEERLEDTYNNYWFNRNDFNSFKSQFLRLKDLDVNKINLIAKKNRSKYIDRYSNKTISDELHQIINRYS